MRYKNATVEDIPAILELQKKYHVASIDEKDKAEGFVTTLFTQDQMKELIDKENGIAVACDAGTIIAYAMAASWAFWEKWPLFQHMINDLPHTEYGGQKLSIENSYQYGPVCIHKEYRGRRVLIELFDFSRTQMMERYPFMLTFINQVNKRSYHAHTRKLGMEVIKSFLFNNNTYYELGYDTSKSLVG